MLHKEISKIINYLELCTNRLKYLEKKIFAHLSPNEVKISISIVSTDMHYNTFKVTP